MKKLSKLLCAILVLAMLCSSLVFLTGAATEEEEAEPFTPSVTHKNLGLGSIGTTFTPFLDESVEGNLYDGASFGNYDSMSFFTAANSVTEDQSYLTFYAMKDGSINKVNPFYQVNTSSSTPVVSVASGTTAYYVIDFDVASHGELLPYLDVSVMLRRVSDGGGFPFSSNIEIASYLQNNGTWEHVTIIGSMASNEVYLYIDGEFKCIAGYAYNESQVGENTALSPKGMRIDFGLSDKSYSFTKGQNIAFDNFSQRVYTDASLTDGLDKAIATDTLADWSGFINHCKGLSLPAIADVDGVSYSNATMLAQALNTNDYVNVEFLSKPFAPVRVCANAVIDTNGMDTSELFALNSECKILSTSGDIVTTSAPFVSNYSEKNVDKTAAANAMKYKHPDNLLSYFSGTNYNVVNGRGYYLVSDSYTGTSYINERVYAGIVDDQSNTYNDWYPKDAKIAYKLNVNQHIIVDFDISLNDNGKYVFKTITRNSSGGGAWADANDINMAGILSEYELGKFVHVTMVLSPDTLDNTIFINGSYVTTKEDNITASGNGHYFQAIRTGGNSDANVSIANVCIRTAEDASLAAAVTEQNILAWSGNYYNSMYKMPTAPAMATVNGETVYSESELESALFGNKQTPSVVKILHVFEEEITVNCDAIIYTYGQDVKFVDKDGNALVATNGVINLDVPYIANKLVTPLNISANGSVSDIANAIKHSDITNLLTSYQVVSVTSGKWGTDGYRNSALVTNVDTGDVMYVESAVANANGTLTGNNEYANINFNSTLSYQSGENEYIVVDMDVAYEQNDGMLFFELVPRADDTPYRSSKVYLSELGLGSQMSHVTLVYDFASNNVYAFVDGQHVLTRSGAMSADGYRLYKNGTSIPTNELKLGSNSTDTVTLDNVLIRKNDASTANDELGAALSTLDLDKWSGNVYNSEYVMAKLPAVAVVDGVEYVTVTDLNKVLATDSTTSKKVEFKHVPTETVKVLVSATVETNGLNVDLDYKSGAYKFQNDDMYHVCTGTDYAYASNKIVLRHNAGSTVYEFVTINKDNCDEFATPVLWFYNNDPANVNVQVVYYVYGDAIQPIEQDMYLEGSTKYQLSYFNLSHSLEIGEAVSEFPVASKSLTETWYYVKVRTSNATYAATDMKYAATVNANIEFTFYVNKSQTITNTGKVVEIDGVEYVAFVYTIAPHQIDEIIKVEFEVADFLGNVYTQRQQISFVEYAAALLESGHDDDTKALVLALLNYANEAHALFENGEKMPAVTELLETYADLLVTEELGQTADVADLKNVIRSASLKLHSAPEFVFKLAKGMRGTVLFTYTGIDGQLKSLSVEFDSRKSEQLVTLTGLNVYDVCGDITIEVDLPDLGVSIVGNYNLATYANGLGEDNAFAVALYNYAKLAKEYVVNDYVANV